MPDTDYFLLRAKQESILAIQADHPAAAAAHQNLSSRYSAQAVMSIVDEQDTARERARHRGLVESLEGLGALGAAKNR
jgi:hypothetical protein